MYDNFLKSTLTAYNSSTQELVENSNVAFANNYKSTGCSISHAAGSEAINLTKSGVYFVTFSVSAAGAAGDISVQLFRNGVAVPSAIATGTTTALTDIINLSASTIIEVDKACPCRSGSNSIPLTLVNTGVDATYSFASITVYKLA